MLDARPPAGGRMDRRTDARAFFFVVIFVFKTPWDTIAQSQGQWLLFDQIHLGERGAEVIKHLVANFITPRKH